MNRQEKIEHLADIFIGAGVTKEIALEISTHTLDKLFPPLPPIERDEDYDRDYIPLPGGYEVQTKGKGSTFRLAGPRGIGPRRMPLTGTWVEHEWITEMALRIRKAYGE